MCIHECDPDGPCELSALRARCAEVEGERDALRVSDTRWLDEHHALRAHYTSFDYIGKWIARAGAAESRVAVLEGAIGTVLRQLDNGGTVDLRPLRAALAPRKP